jgi:septum site-determining protein MinD
VSGTILAITSGKGGVGKSTTALNLAVSLGTDAASVVLVDADLGMANIGGMLDIRTGPTLHDVLAGLADVESTVVEEYEAVDVVPGGRDLTEYAEADPNRLPTVLATLTEMYEYVVVDAGAGLGYADVVPIETADEVILATTPSDAAIGDTAKLAKFSDRIDAEVRGVVVTRADEQTNAEVVATKVGTEPLGVVPEDTNVQGSIDAGLPLELYAPDSPAGVAYSRIADVILEGAEPYTDDMVQYPEKTEEPDASGVSDLLGETEEPDDSGVSDPLGDVGEPDDSGVSDLLGETEEPDASGVSGSLGDVGERDDSGVSDPLGDPGEPDASGASDLLGETEEPDASGASNPLGDVGERDANAAPDPLEGTAPVTGDAEASSKTSGPDGPPESTGEVTESAADDDPDDTNGGGLLSRLRNLF